VIGTTIYDQKDVLERMKKRVTQARVIAVSARKLFRDVRKQTEEKREELVYSEGFVQRAARYILEKGCHAGSREQTDNQVYNYLARFKLPLRSIIDEASSLANTENKARLAATEARMNAERVSNVLESFQPIHDSLKRDFRTVYSQFPSDHANNLVQAAHDVPFTMSGEFLTLDEIRAYVTTSPDLAAYYSTTKVRCSHMNAAF
jgi:hypothetical protein